MSRDLWGIAMMFVAFMIVILVGRIEHYDQKALEFDINGLRIVLDVIAVVLFVAGYYVATHYAIAGLFR